MTRKLMLFAMAIAPMFAQPALAQKTEEQKLIDYQNCVIEYQARGMGGFAAADYYCANREYGGESPPSPTYPYPPSPGCSPGRYGNLAENCT
jgi:hypothetical protein